MPTVVVPSIGDVTDPEVIQQIYDDIDALEDDVSVFADTGRCIARGDRQSNSTAASAETSVLRLDNVPMVSGRIYEIRTNPLTADCTVNGDTCRLLIRINTSGTATTASTNLAIAQVRLADNAVGEVVLVGLLYNPGANVTASILLSHSRAAGTGNVNVNGSAVLPIQLMVIDHGPDPTDSGVDL
jgi:hypothetical protein